VDEAQAMAARGMALGLAGRPEVDPHWNDDLAEAHQVAGEVELERERPALAATHFDEALRYARRAGNLLAECATISRQSDAALRLGDAEGALAHAVASLELADRIGFSQFQASARVNQGRALRALGRLDEARSAFTAAIAISEQFGSHAIARALVEIGEVQLEQGEAARARATLERALAAARRSGDVHVVARAGAALATLLAAEDLDAAVDLLDATRPPDGASRWRSVFRLAEGWVALRAGERDRADALADAIVDEAAAGDALPALASGLELRCFASAEPARRAASLEEAARIWATLGHPLAEARAVLALQAIGCAVAESEIERARATLARQAVRIPGLGVGLGAMIGADGSPPLAIRTFGRFTVYHGGVEVPSTAWQSRKARDLLKLLVCRRGAVTVRDVLLEALWPGEAPSKTRNRLSVALNVARGVLDPDGVHETDWYVVADRDGLRLDLEHVQVDVEHFLDSARTGLEAARAGSPDARALLDAAEAAYGGEFLEEDAFADWATPLRERVRSAYVDLLRALTRVEHESDRFHLRLLEIDPYDEDAHLDLVRMLASSGRHGEARRAYRRYVTRMAEIGVEPEPLDLAGASGAAL
jgi:DNA-binding SARP family transcriptional activator